MGIWEKVGNIGDPLNDNALFCCSNDSGSKPGEQVEISSNWRVWRIGDNDYTRVERLEGEMRRVDIGVIVTPLDILTRLQTGKYNFFTLDFYSFKGEDIIKKASLK